MILTMTTLTRHSSMRTNVEHLLQSHHSLSKIWCMVPTERPAVMNAIMGPMTIDTDVGAAPPLCAASSIVFL